MKRRRARTKILPVVLGMFFAAVPVATGGGHHVGNGDPLGDMYLTARDHLGLLIRRLDLDHLKPDEQPMVRDYLGNEEKRLALAEDIEGTPHDWEPLEHQKTCASSDHKSKAVIHFLYERCEHAAGTFGEAVKLLLHESLHHLGADEIIAYELTRVVYSAFASNALMWVPLATPADRLLADRYNHAAVWTGVTGDPETSGKMIIWGGNDHSLDTAVTGVTGGIFELEKRKWTFLRRDGVPPRVHPNAIWAKGRMYVWGGFTDMRPGDREWLNSGMAFDPNTGAWEDLVPPGGVDRLVGRQTQTIVWTGKEFIIWGGATEEKPLPGYGYNPETKTWREIKPPDSRLYRLAWHSAVWTGEEMIVFGGFGLDPAALKKDNERYLSLMTFRYNPETNEWSSAYGKDHPSPRGHATAVWTGKEMIVWGGRTSSFWQGRVYEGARYNPKTSQWRPIDSTTSTRIGHTAVWTGREMLVFGGVASGGGGVMNEDPRNLRPAKLALSFEPTEDDGEFWGLFTLSRCFRTGASVVWTGKGAIVWGGHHGIDEGGGIFFPMR